MITFDYKSRYALVPVICVAAIGLVLLPGDENARPVAGTEVANTRALPSYIVRLPEPAPIRVADIEPIAATSEPAAAASFQTASLELTGADTALATSEQAADVSPPDREAVARARVTSAVNVRAGPSTANQVLYLLGTGEMVETGATSGGWVEVISAAGEHGWVYGRYLDRDADPAATAPDTVQVAAIAPERSTGPESPSARLSSATALRAGPTANADQLFVLDAGERVTVAETRGNWVRVVLRSGATGWIRMR